MTHETENAKKVRILERALLIAARVKFGDGTATDAIRRAELVRSWRIEAMKYLEEEDRQKEKYGPIRPGEAPLEFAQRHDWLMNAGRELNDYTISRDITNKGDGEHVFVDAEGTPHSPINGNKLTVY